LGEVCDVRDAATHRLSNVSVDVGFSLMDFENFSRWRESTTQCQTISEADFIDINKSVEVDRGDIIYADWHFGTIRRPGCR